MTGTLGGALAARGISAPDNLVTHVEADIEQEGRIIVLARVRLHYQLSVPRAKRAEAQRAIEVHHDGCPVYQSLPRGIAVEWSADITEEWRLSGVAVKGPLYAPSVRLYANRSQGYDLGVRATFSVRFRGGKETSSGPVTDRASGAGERLP